MAEKRRDLGLRPPRGTRRRPGIAPPGVRLPARSGLPREEVISHQRQRLLDGITAAVFHHGYEDTRVADIVELAGVSRPTFYGIFASKESCFAAAYADGVEQLEAVVGRRVGSERERAEILATGLGAGLEFLAANPDLAHLLLVESMATARPLRLEHERSLARLADLLRQAPPPAGGEDLPLEMARLLAGGLVSHLAGRVLAGEVEDLPSSRQLLLNYLLTPLSTDASDVVRQRVAAG